jgi:DNA-binding HxlR family transcriptional regulator
MTNQDLRTLGESRWAIPIMAFLSVNKGAKFVVIANRFQMSRDSLVRTLDHLMKSKWVIRNPGHGHPMRPEYILTTIGIAIGEFCKEMTVQREKLGLEPQDLSRWSLPVIGELHKDWIRFTDLQNGLQPVTPRALSLTIKQLMSYELIVRNLKDEFPPVAFYGLSNRGKRIATIITEQLKS